MKKADLKKIQSIDHWRYQLVRMDVSCPDEPWHELHEVHVNKRGKVILWANVSAKVGGETPADALNTLLLMALDTSKYPVLKESELPNAKAM